ncbi:MAG: 3-deoxy-manno-octulosonate cytidylyltransferase [Pyrinomonadaceae bacterium]
MCGPVNNTVPNPSLKAIVIIPARHASTRLQGKPLLEIKGRAMVLHVLERALAARNISRTLVATDDQRIFDVVREAGYEAVMTSEAHRTGTDRVAEVAAGIYDADVIVNVQGDEPLISPRTIEVAVEALVNDLQAKMSTTSEKIFDAGDVLSPDVVKVVSDGNGRALYFSRSSIPYPREAVRRHGSLEAALEREPSLLANFRKHTGLYAYRRDFLLEYARWSATPLEQSEALEQLRALEHGVKIVVVEADAPSIGVDTPDDLARVKQMMETG